MASKLTISQSNTHPDGIVIAETSDEKLAFYGATPVVRRAGAAQAVATDPATTMALANELRAALVALGLIKGAA